MRRRGRARRGRTAAVATENLENLPETVIRRRLAFFDRLDDRAGRQRRLDGLLGDEVEHADAVRHIEQFDRLRIGDVLDLNALWG
jgi:hypothetical protein